MQSTLQSHHKRAFFFLAALLFTCFLSGSAFLSQHEAEPLLAGQGVSAQFQLSKWHESLAGSRSDSDVYYLSPDEWNPDSMWAEEAKALLSLVS